MLAASYSFTAPPQITVQLKPAEGIEKQEVALECKASGDPPPKYNFYKVQQLVQSCTVGRWLYVWLCVWLC